MLCDALPFPPFLSLSGSCSCVYSQAASYCMSLQYYTSPEQIPFPRNKGYSQCSAVQPSLPLCLVYCFFVREASLLGSRCPPPPPARWQSHSREPIFMSSTAVPMPPRALFLFRSVVAGLDSGSNGSFRGIAGLLYLTGAEYSEVFQ
jgi:hypothetical protein